jgi:hypothetical protein
MWILHCVREMVNCPQCGMPMKKVGRESKYYCDNERCIVAFVCHPLEPNKVRIAYTGLGRQISFNKYHK